MAGGNKKKIKGVVDPKIREATTIEQQIDPRTGEMIWSSPLEDVFKQRTDGLSFIELLESNRLVDKNGLPCPPPDKDQVKTAQQKAAYYNAWVALQLEMGGLQFYKSTRDTQPTKVMFDPESNKIRMARRPAPARPTRPGFWERRRDRLLREQGLPGTPRMQAYREAMYRYDQAANRRAENSLADRARREQLSPLMEYKVAAVNKLEKLLNEKNPNKQFDEKTRSSIVTCLTTLIACDGYGRLEKSDPEFAKELLEQCVANKKLKKDKQIDPAAMMGGDTRKLVEDAVRGIKSPADLEKFTQNRGISKLINNYFVSARLAQKEPLNPKGLCADGKPIADENTKQKYDALAEEAAQAMDRLKKLSSIKGPIPPAFQEDLKRDLAIVTMQNYVGRIVGGTASDSRAAKEVMGVITGDKDLINGSLAGNDDYEECIGNWKVEIDNAMKVENMTGEDLSKFLSVGRESKLARDMVEKTRNAPDKNLNIPDIKEYDHKLDHQKTAEEKEDDGPAIGI